MWNLETVFAKLRSESLLPAKYKDDPVTLNRILQFLNEYKEQVQLKGTQQKVRRGLERFEVQNH